ncbi:MAG: heavy-metal-associated domain-containing protein [Desertifilum sp. SIO1I2]|nr:heavy-metal-associated domain-containing protein [Desertifilum sp. SIO1I2]
MALEMVVPNMVCDGCAEKITEAIKTVDSEAKINIDLPTKHVSVDTEVSLESIEQAITAIGYEVEP